MSDTSAQHGRTPRGARNLASSRRGAVPGSGPGGVSGFWWALDRFCQGSTVAQGERLNLLRCAPKSGVGADRPNCVCAGAPEYRPAASASRGWAPVRGVSVSRGAAQALEPAARAMGGACSCGTKVDAEDSSKTKDRLGAPNLPRSAPTCVTPRRL